MRGINPNVFIVSEPFTWYFIPRYLKMKKVIMKV